MTTNTEELIVYSNSRNGLGIRILGTKRATNKSGVYIKELLDGGLAQQDGRLKIGDQVLAINDESSIGISREHAVNLLRTAAASNQVRFRVKHFSPLLSSVEYQKLLHDEKSTDDDDEDNHRFHNVSQDRNNNHHHHNNTTTTDEVRMRKSSRRHYRQDNQDSTHRHSTYNVAYENSKHDQQEGNNLSHDALQALLNSRFKLIDLVDLVKKMYPKLLLNDQKRELQFVEQLSETNTDGRMTLKDFERQSSILLGERINLLVPFFSSSSSSNHSTHTNDAELVLDLRREITSYRVTIDELQTKIITCEKSQRLSNEVEVEYEELLKFLSDQLHQYKMNELNHFKQIRANDQLIQKLFNYLSIYVNQPNDEHILTQLKYEYEQQQKYIPNSHDTSTTFVPNHKYQERF